MPKVLSPESLDHYRRNGYHYPVDILSREEAADCRRRLETFEAAQDRKSVV